MYLIRVKIVLFCLNVKVYLINVIISIVIWLINISFLLDVECLKNVWYKFFVMVLEVMSNWDEIVFIIVVKIVVNKNLVISGWNKIFLSLRKIVFGLDNVNFCCE